MNNPQNSFTVTLLGTASAMPTEGRNQSAQALQVRGRLFLVDCGEGVQSQLHRFHVPMMRIEALFLSHIHGDHVFGLFGLLSTMGMKGRQTPLDVFAPVNFGPILKFFLSYYGEGLAFEIRFHPLKMRELEVVLETKTVEVLAFPLRHGIDTFGFLFREKEPLMNVHKEAIAQYGLTLSEIGALKRGEDLVREGETLANALLAYKPYEARSYAYCSDTAPFPELASWLRGVSVVYHEATYLQQWEDQAAQRLHSTTLQAAALARDAGAGKLLIAHYSSRESDTSLYQAECRTLFPESYAVNDGDVVEI